MGGHHQGASRVSGGDETGHAYPSGCIQGRRRLIEEDQ